MAVSNWLDTEAGQKLRTTLEGTSGAARDSLIEVINSKLPGFSDELEFEGSLDTLTAESMLRGYGESSAVLPKDVLQLRSEIGQTRVAIEEINKTTVDEHLTNIESLSGVDMISGNYDSVFTFMKEAERVFKTKISDEDSSRRKRLAKSFYESYDSLWPKQALSPGFKFTPTGQTGFTKAGFTEGFTGEKRYAHGIEPGLNELFALSKTLEEQEQYYSGYFLEPEYEEQYEEEFLDSSVKKK